MKKHTFDPLSFVAGVVFLMISASAVLNTNLDYELSGWVLPASALVLGVGLLAASLRGMRTAEDHGPAKEDHGPRTTDHGPEAEEDRGPAEEDNRQQTTDNRPDPESGDTLVEDAAGE